MSIITVLGVDPSLRNFGLVLADLNLDTMKFQVKEMNLAKSEADAKKGKVVRKNSEDLDRARLLHEAFQEACSKAKFCFVEVPVGSQSARAMASYGICIGVLASCPIPMIQVTPTEVKVAGTGIKTATKQEMIEAAVAEHPEAKWLTRRLKGELTLVDANEHLADATFAIEAGIKTTEFRAAASMMRSVLQVA